MLSGATSEIRTVDCTLTSALLWPVCWYNCAFESGATSEIRTPDPRITSALLWPTELRWLTAPYLIHIHYP